MCTCIQVVLWTCVLTYIRFEVLYYSYPMPEREIPQWAQQERLHDLTWIGENLHVFWPAAQKQYQEQGRGALVIDITVRVGERGVHPFTYAPQKMIEEGSDADLKRLVREYVPEREMVVTLLKSQERMSTYRVQARF